ncbi:hypothetical protein LEMLEM_LOCUS13071, partial [Lemmus lemmus]
IEQTHETGSQVKVSLSAGHLLGTRRRSKRGACSPGCCLYQPKMVGRDLLPDWPKLYSLRPSA